MDLFYRVILLYSLCISIAAVGATSEIDRILETTYDGLDEQLKSKFTYTILRVKYLFHGLNIMERSQLPTTTVGTVELFQEMAFDSSSLTFIELALNIKQPEFIHPPIVGYGYDILRDESVARSPFNIQQLKPTSIGFLLPSMINCTWEDEQTVEHFTTFHSQENYIISRLQALGIDRSLLHVNLTAFTGTVRASYNNLRPDPDVFVSLTAIQEIRNFKFSLIQSTDLNDDFISAVNELTPFKQGDRESPKEWQSFFNTFGTHIVTSAFGGGYMEGKGSGQAIKDNLGSENILNAIKNNLISFFPELPPAINRESIEISHFFFGGSVDRQLAQAHKLSPIEREDLLDQWKSNVRLDPRISEMSLQLIPISAIVTKVNASIGEHAENALSHLLNGTLVYQRKKLPKTTTTSSPLMITLSPAPSTKNYENNTELQLSSVMTTSVPIKNSQSETETVVESTSSIAPSANEGKFFECNIQNEATSPKLFSVKIFILLKVLLWSLEYAPFLIK